MHLHAGHGDPWPFARAHMPVPGLIVNQVLSNWATRGPAQIAGKPFDLFPCDRMTTTKSVAFAGYNEAQIRVLERACSELSSPGLHLAPEVWDGTRKDLLVINPENTLVVQSAIRLTTRRGGRYLVLPVLHAAEDFAASVLAVRRALASALPDARSPGVPAMAAHGNDARPSLFDTLRDLIADGVDVSATCSSCHVLILPDSGKVRARNELAFGMFRTFFGRSDWEIRPMLEPVDLEQYPIAHSLESFLIDASLRIRFRLPNVPPGRFRLTAYPDLGELTAQTDVLSLASFAMRPQESVKALAELAGVDGSRANAFVFAASILGLVDRTPAEPRVEVIADTPSKAEKRSIWTRIANRFGLGSVKEEAEDA